MVLNLDVGPIAFDRYETLMRTSEVWTPGKVDPESTFGKAIIAAHQEWSAQATGTIEAF